jgi:uncharacterized protein YaaQ
MLKKVINKILRRISPLSPSKNFLNNAFVEAIPSPVFWLDHNKVYRGCNQLFADLMGFEKPSDIVGLKDNNLPFVSTDLEDRDRIFNFILSGEAPAKIIYDCIIGVHDETIWAQKRFTPLKNRREKIIGVLGVVVDISEKVKRRKDMEDHMARQHILGSFLEELNTTFMAGLNYKELIEKFSGILHSESGARSVIFVKANAQSPQGFIRSYTEKSLDVSKLFNNRGILFKAAQKSGYLDQTTLMLFKDVISQVNTIFCYRMESNDILKYDEIILLINPQAEKLETASVFFSLASHIMQSCYMRRFLIAKTLPDSSSHKA